MCAASMHRTSIRCKNSIKQKISIFGLNPDQQQWIEVQFYPLSPMALVEERQISERWKSVRLFLIMVHGHNRRVGGKYA